MTPHTYLSLVSTFHSPFSRHRRGGVGNVARGVMGVWTRDCIVAVCFVVVAGGGCSQICVPLPKFSKHQLSIESTMQNDTSANFSDILPAAVALV